MPLPRRLDQLQKLLKVDGLTQVVEGSGSHRFDRGLNRAKRSYHNDLQLGVSVLGLPQQIKTTFTRHFHVKEADFECLATKQFER